MPINVSGGMANAANSRGKVGSLKKLQEKLSSRRLAKERGDIAVAPPQDPDVFLEDDEEEYVQTKLGRLLGIIDPFIIFLIILNAIQMGVATFDFVETNKSINDVFELVDKIFLIIFSVEVTLALTHHLRLDRMIIEDSRIFFPKITQFEREEQQEDRGWIIFDGLVVILSWSFTGVSIIRAFRILRILRLIKKIENLKNVVGALFAIMPKMGVVAFFLVIMFLIFGIAFTDMFGNLYDEGYGRYNWFGSLDRTWLTLFQIMCFDSWHPVARAMMRKYSYCWILFVLFTIITGFVIMNLIIAIICESLVKLTEKKKLEREKEEIQNRVAEEKAQEKIDGKSMLQKQGSKASFGFDDSSTVYTIEYMWHLEDVLDEVLQDQDVLLETVEKLSAVLEDVLATTNQKKASEIRSVLLSFPPSMRI